MLINEDKLSYINIADTADKVYGIAYVKKGFKAQLHFHKEPETYFFIYGSGKLYIKDRIMEVHSPYKLNIKSNRIHAMTPITDYVLLFYVFSKGPFDKINYTYLNSHL